MHTPYAKARGPEEQGHSCSVWPTSDFPARISAALRTLILILGFGYLWFVAGTLDDRKARVFREARITDPTFALIECGTARGLDFAHVTAVAA